MELDIAIMRRERAQAYAFGRSDEKVHPTGFLHSADFVDAVDQEGPGSFPATYQRLAEVCAPEESTVRRTSICGLDMRLVRLGGLDSIAVAGRLLTPSEADLLARALQSLALAGSAHNAKGVA